MEISLSSTQRMFLERHITGPLGGLAVSGDTSAPVAEPDASPDDASFEKSWGTARAQWLKAEEAVGKQISQLQTAFRGSGVDVLQDIADTGLPALTGSTRTKAMAAIFDVDRTKSTPNGKILQGAEKRLAALQSQLGTNPRVQACDENPFGVKVSISATLGGALDEMRRVLRNDMPG